jgi:carotenoid 1,2-hydratase
MTSQNGKISVENFSFSSCVKSDVWHPEKDTKGYEWWYFDALSDDGKDGIVIIFLDNFIFSPRYNSLNQQLVRNNLTEFEKSRKIPALAFVYYKNGKPIYRAINEFGIDEFVASPETPECRIGNNSFYFESAPYGSGYVLSINLKLPKKRVLKAKFEWLSIESDLFPQQKTNDNNKHFWNLVAPRSDVTGRITIKNKSGNKIDEIKFRGTGYHDHNIDSRWLPNTVSDWQWGRSHFPDSTVVFYRYNEIGIKETITKLFLIKDENLLQQDAKYEVQEYGRDKFGLKYPKRFRITTEDKIKLRVKQQNIIDSSFFYLRFLSEMTITLRDGKPRKTIGFTEHLAPKTLKYRWLDWLVNMRIGRKGKSSFLP